VTFKHCRFGHQLAQYFKRGVNFTYCRLDKQLVEEWVTALVAKAAAQRKSP